MSKRLELFLEAMERTKTLDDLHALVKRLRDLYQVEHIVYHSVSGTGDQYAVLTYDPLWVDRYITEGYARIDPVVLGCFQRFTPVNWKDLDWTGKPVKRFLGEAVENGVGNQGFSVPIRGPNGQFALLSANDRAGDAEWAAFFEEFQADLLLIAHFLNTKALELEHRGAVQPGPSLSPREVDVMTLLALGQSRAQAADHLHISEHTLRAYLESARAKLGGMNTTHAVAMALSRGLIML
jgi:DNA-binding CsgD family transcriptional regulator